VRRGGTDHMNSVLSALSCRWFDLVQRASDSTQLPISWQSDANWCGRQLPWIDVSSQTSPLDDNYHIAVHIKKQEAKLSLG